MLKLAGEEEERASHSWCWNCGVVFVLSCITGGQHNKLTPCRHSASLLTENDTPRKAASQMLLPRPSFSCQKLSPTTVEYPPNQQRLPQKPLNTENAWLQTRSIVELFCVDESNDGNVPMNNNAIVCAKQPREISLESCECFSGRTLEWNAFSCAVTITKLF